MSSPSGSGRAESSRSHLGGPSSPRPDATSPSDDSFLDIVSKWGDDGRRGDNTVRTSKMLGKFGVSPPPPPGPPPSDPPPLPPTSSHPFAASSSTLGKAAGKLSNVAHFRKPSNSRREPSAHPPLPPPSAQLPALPSSVTGHIRNTSSSSRNSVKRYSTSPPASPTTGTVPRVSPRSSSLLSPPKHANAEAGPSNSSSTTLLRPAKPIRTPSRHLLQTALDLAQRAVEMDKSNDVLGALAAYREAVVRLKNVMERVGVEPKDDGKKRTSTGRAEEEGRTLRGIHDAYVARIQLLSSFEDDQEEEQGDAEDDQYDFAQVNSTPTVPLRQDHRGYTQTSASTATLVPGPAVHHSPLSETTTTSGDRTPRPSLDDTATGIGNLMLNDPGDSTLGDISPVKSTNFSPTNFSSPFSSRPTASPRTSSRNIHEDMPSQTPADAPIIPPPRRTSIGATIPPSPQAHFASPSGAGRHGSPSASMSSTGRGARHLQTPADLEQPIREENEEMEVLTRTPQHTAQPIAADGSVVTSGQLVQAQTDRRGSDSDTGGKSLPPVPLSAPLPGHQLIGLGRPTSGSYLVSPSVAQGTISQRRQSRGLDATKTIDGLPSATPFPEYPFEPTQSSMSPTAPRSRSRSQPGQPTEPDPIPPLPSLHHKASLSSTVNPRVTSNPTQGGLRINTNSPNTLAPGLPHSASASGQLISPQPDPQPKEIAHRAFHLLRGLCMSMDPESSGYYLTGYVHIDSNVWKLPAKWTNTIGKPVGPPKIASQDLKVRIMEALLLHLEIVRQTGMQLLEGDREYTRAKTQPAHNSRAVGIAEDFCSALDMLDEEMDTSYKSLAKAGVPVRPWKGKGKASSSKSWGSRFTKTMDKMTSSKVFDSPDTYVDLLSNFCFTVQVLEEHLYSFTGPCTPAYASLPAKSYLAVESRILSAAQSVGVVVVPFIMDDLKQFMERYMKCGARWAENPMVV